MKKWPTINELSEACLEDVHKVWSGLGYYSRATRLLEGAKKIQDTSQHLPQKAKELQQILPGKLSGLSTKRRLSQYRNSHIVEKFLVSMFFQHFYSKYRSGKIHCISYCINCLQRKSRFG